MSNLTLNLSPKAEKTINELKDFYEVDSKAEVIRKALALLKIAKTIEEGKGELVARKDSKESTIIVR